MKKKEMHIVTGANPKGGVGKTTTIVNLSHFLVKLYGFKVLVIDMDNNCSITRVMTGETSPEREGDITDVLRRKEDPEKVIMKSRFDGVWLIPASEELSLIEGELSKKAGGDLLLNQWLRVYSEKISNEFEFDAVLIDSAGDRGIIEQNAFNAADTLLLVVTPTVEGISNLKMFGEYFGKPVNKNEAVIICNNYVEDDDSATIMEVLKGRIFGKYLIKGMIPNHHTVKSSFDSLECVPVAAHDEEEFKDLELNPYTQYVNVISELKERGIVNG